MAGWEKNLSGEDSEPRIIHSWPEKEYWKIQARMILLAMIGGLVLNRFDVGLLAQAHLGGQSYAPSLAEFAISFGILSAGILAFGAVAKFFQLFENAAVPLAVRSDPVAGSSSQLSEVAED